MDQKKMALSLGLPEGASESEIAKTISQMKEASAQVVTLQKEKETLRLAQITQVVDAAIGKNLIGSERRNQFLELGKKIGADDLKTTFDAMAPRTKLTDIVGAADVPLGGKASYAKLSELPVDKLEALRSENMKEYARLYRAEYGVECEL